MFLSHEYILILVRIYIDINKITGPRRGATIELHKDVEDENGKKPKKKLKPVEPATNPTMLAFGGFILWYGWFGMSFYVFISKFLF